MAQKDDDITLFLAPEYLLEMVQAAYVLEKIPHHLPIAGGMDLEIKMPTAVEVVAREEAPLIEIAVPVKAVMEMTVTIAVTVTIEAMVATLFYTYLDEATKNLISTFGGIGGKKDLLSTIEETMKEKIHFSFDLQPFLGDLPQPEVSVVTHRDTAYLAITLGQGEQVALPEGEGFYLRIPSASLEALSRSVVNIVNERKQDRRFCLSSLAIRPLKEKFSVVAKGKLRFGFKVEVSVTVLKEGEATLSIDSSTLAISMGWLNSGLLAIVCGAALFPFAGITGGVGAAIFGVAIAKTVLSAVARRYRSVVEEKARQLLSYLPLRLCLDTQNRGLFFKKEYAIEHHIEKIDIDETGFSVVGSVTARSEMCMHESTGENSAKPEFPMDSKEL